MQLATPVKNINACEDFFTTVVETHGLATAMSVFKMSSVDDKSTSILFTEDYFSQSKEDRTTILQLMQQTRTSSCEIHVVIMWLYFALGL